MARSCFHCLWILYFPPATVYALLRGICAIFYNFSSTRFSIPPTRLSDKEISHIQYVDIIKLVALSARWLSYAQLLHRLF